MTAKLSEAPATPTRGRWRRRTYTLLAIALGILPLVVLELVLVASDLGAPRGYEDPFVGFSSTFPLFELDARTERYRTAHSRLYFFGPQEFAAVKPAAAFRGFCVGGSTVLGHPFHPPTAFAKWLELELQAANPQREIEMINCGGMSYASYRLIGILEEVLQHDPDVIVVLTGHNEFLEDRTYDSIKKQSSVIRWAQERVFSLRTATLARRGVDYLVGYKAGRTVLEPEVDARLDHESGYATYKRDPAWWDGVATHFEWNLRRLVQMCREHDVPIVFVVPGSNLRDCPPFKSENGSDLSEPDRARWESEFALGEAVEPENPQSALTHYRKALEVDDQFALLHYRVARCLDRLGRLDEAASHYQAAKELDVCPLRIRERLKQSIRTVSQETETPVVDADQLVRDLSPSGVPGYNWYVDQVHPSIRGHQMIAQALAAEMARAGIFELANQWTPGERQVAYARHLGKLGDLYLAKGRQRVEWLENWARRDRLREDTFPVDGRGYLDLGLSFLAFGEYDAAKTAFQEAVNLESSLVALLLRYAEMYLQEGRPRAAQLILRLVKPKTETDETLAGAVQPLQKQLLLLIEQTRRGN